MMAYHKGLRSRTRDFTHVEKAPAALEQSGETMHDRWREGAKQERAEKAERFTSVTCTELNQFPDQTNLMSEHHRAHLLQITRLE